jgi:hypothetical protein
MDITSHYVPGGDGGTEIPVQSNATPELSYPDNPVRLSSRLEKFNRITIGVFYQDLFAAGAYFHLIAKM